MDSFGNGELCHREDLCVLRLFIGCANVLLKRRPPKPSHLSFRLLRFAPVTNIGVIVPCSR